MFSFCCQSIQFQQHLASSRVCYPRIGARTARSYETIALYQEKLNIHGVEVAIETLPGLECADLMSMQRVMYPSDILSELR